MLSQNPKFLEQADLSHDQKAEYFTKEHIFSEEPILYETKTSYRLFQFSPSLFKECLISAFNYLFGNKNCQCIIQETGNSTISEYNWISLLYGDYLQYVSSIFTNVNGIFGLYRFNINHSTKTSAVIRNNSEADFINYKFDNISDTSMLAIDRSFTNICICKFKSTKQISVHLFTHSAGNIYNSQFLFQEGEAILLKAKCHAKIKKCKFKNCKGSATSIDDSSKIHVKKCEFYNFVHTFINLSQNKESQQTFIRKCDMKKRKRKRVKKDINKEIRPIDTNFLNNENDQDKMKKIEKTICSSNDNHTEEEEEADDFLDNMDLKIKAIRRFRLWFLNKKTDNSYETFQTEFLLLVTWIINDQSELNLARTVYLLTNKDSIKFKKCTLDELRDFYDIRNYDSINDISRRNMKELIYKIKDNVEDEDYQSIFDLHVYVLLVYIFQCLHNPDINTVESCSYDDDDDIYWISWSIQLDNMENTRNQILDELNLSLS